MLLDLAFPRRCPVCDRPVKPSNAYICSECRDKLVYIKEPRCRKCGKQLEKAENEYCYDCGSKRHIYDRGAALYSYGSIRLSLYRLKYGGRQEYAVFLGQDMAGRLGREILSWKPDALVPVPLHPAREKKEGITRRLCWRPNWGNSWISRFLRASWKEPGIQGRRRSWRVQSVKII